MGGLRTAPDDMGKLKRVQLDEERRKQAQVYGRWYMTPDWGYLVAEPTSEFLDMSLEKAMANRDTAWKLDFDTFQGTLLSTRR